MYLSESEIKSCNKRTRNAQEQPNRRNEKDPEEVGQVGFANESSRLVSTVRRTMFNTENRDTRR